MKKNIICAIAVSTACVAGHSLKADTLADWTFQTGTSTNALFPQLGNHTTLANVPSDIGAGELSAFHAASATVFSSPSGNGSTNSVSANTWSVGDYYQFSVSTLGVGGINLSFAQVGSSTGPRDFALEYSTDGSAFTVFTSYSLPSSITSWSPSSQNAGSIFTFDLSSITALDNQSSIYLRLIDTDTTSVGGGTVGTSGSGRVDDIVIGTAPVPEPSTIALAAFGGLACWYALRRKR